MAEEKGRDVEMNNRVLFRLCDIFNKEEINLEHCDYEELLGEIILNRMAGVAYNNLSFLNKRVPKEFKEALQVIFSHNMKKAQRFKKNVKYMSMIFSECGFSYAFLKGSFLSTVLYDEGLRTSNDIDILLNSEDISSCQQLLIDNGFIQGHFSETGGIIPATRREIIQSRMNYGETVPFLKLLDNELLEIDVNFSVDFKPSSNGSIVKQLIRNSRDIDFEGIKIRTLCDVDFIIHLCCHLYKEATTFNWVVSNRDLTLYKFCDINLIMHHYGNKEYFNELLARIHHFNVEKECYYTFENSSIIYPGIRDIEGFEEFMECVKPNDLHFMKQIVFPMEKKLYEYNMGFEEWFFCKDKITNLKEISYEENGI